MTVGSGKVAGFCITLEAKYNTAYINIKLHVQRADLRKTRHYKVYPVPTMSDSRYQLGTG